MSKKLTKMMWYDGLSSVKYLQNFCCFFYSKAEEKKNCVNNELIDYNFSCYILVMSYNKIDELDKFDPGAPCNERNFFNSLCHLGNKMNKKQQTKIIMFGNGF